MNALDAIAWTIAEKIHVQYRIIRIILDALLIIAGYLMGGVVGIGSIIGVFGLGPLVAYLNGVFNKK